MIERQLNHPRAEVLRNVLIGLLKEHNEETKIGALVEDVSEMLQPRYDLLRNLANYFRNDTTLAFIRDHLKDFEDAMAEKSFFYIEYGRKANIVITDNELDNVSSIQQFSSGDIRDVLNTDNPPVGKYYLRGGLGFNLNMGGDLDCPPEKLILVEVIVADSENKLTPAIDVYTHSKFEEGETVVLLGEYQAAISFDTLKGLLEPESDRIDVEVISVRDILTGKR